ncbi:MAG: thioesterase family protein [Coprococcus sp.]
MEMKVGMKFETEIIVTEGMLANHNDSQLPAIDLPPVFSTPSMINMMELTCAKLMEQCLEDGKGSVGMSVDIKHLASTPCGKKVRCEVEIKEVSGKKVTFNVNAYDENGLIGTGIHKRAVINKAVFFGSVNG